MYIQNLKRQFTKIGATLEVELLPTMRRSRQFRRNPGASPVDFLLDVRDGKNGETFILSIRKEVQNLLEFVAVDVQPPQRHLLLLSKDFTMDIPRKEKFLCGHDERHWFVAGVPNQGIVTVRDAFEALKPDTVVKSQERHRVKPKNRNKRHNTGFIRQGEWFFIPQPTFEVGNPHLILRNEPLRRGMGKPHVVEQLYRTGGETVYVNFKYPNGLTLEKYAALINRKPEAKSYNWRIMRRNPTVYARGKVRHPDHKTIVLPFWHQVAVNGEIMSSTVAFLD
jgi:hypothetical protein